MSNRTLACTGPYIIDIDIVELLPMYKAASYGCFLIHDKLFCFIFGLISSKIVNHTRCCPFSPGFTFSEACHNEPIRSFVIKLLQTRY